LGVAARQCPASVVRALDQRDAAGVVECRDAAADLRCRDADVVQVRTFRRELVIDHQGRDALGDAGAPLETITVVIVRSELDPCARHRGELVGPEAQLLGWTHGPRILRSGLIALSGTLLNAATVLLGGVLGTALGDRLPALIRERVVFGVGLFILAMGMKFAIDSSNLLYLLGSILLGGILGAVLGIDRRLTAFGDALQGASRTRAATAP